jgi:hypothetical protein
MKTYNVEKTVRDNKNYPLSTNIVGTVTANNYTDAMRKAVKKFNNGIWTNIYISIQN